MQRGQTTTRREQIQACVQPTTTPSMLILKSHQGHASTHYQLTAQDRAGGPRLETVRSRRRVATTSDRSSSCATAVNSGKAVRCQARCNCVVRESCSTQCALTHASETSSTTSPCGDRETRANPPPVQMMTDEYPLPKVAATARETLGASKAPTNSRNAAARATAKQCR